MVDLQRQLHLPVGCANNAKKYFCTNTHLKTL